MLRDPATYCISRFPQSPSSVQNTKFLVQNTKFEHISLDDLTSRPCLSTIIYRFFWFYWLVFLNLFKFQLKASVFLEKWWDGEGGIRYFCTDFFSCLSVCLPVLVTDVIWAHGSPLSWNHCESSLASACTTQVMLLPKLCCWPTSCVVFSHISEARALK